MIIQMCGLSGSGKSTIANKTKNILEENSIAVEIIDGDEYRTNVCSDLGFSKEDRHSNIRRLSFIASKFSAHNIVTIICVINPYEQIRKEVFDKYQNVKTIFIDCNLETLKKKIQKGYT
ncbi:MAG: adenylyl-sulfate kinase [Bacteroidetes bacterium]|nr:adenylyl-sulfate kinase [Bacteroidota bacterium]